MNPVSMARNSAAIGDEVCWLDPANQQFPGFGLVDIDASEYLDLGNYDDPTHTFAIEGREVSLMADMNDDIAHILDDEQRLYIF